MFVDLLKITTSDTIPGSDRANYLDAVHLALFEYTFDTGVMGERQANRGGRPRTDQQILADVEDVYLLGEIAHGRVVVDAGNRMMLRGLAREELCLVGFGVGTAPTLLPRGRRIVAAARGEIALAADD